ncbi:GP63-like [Trichomonas vaginalis G3]|uniref:GP63-like n=3 Tax=Trichomonas vaginalis (strain ATCC PRA-98 / G3) TaxID=412133 RepID=A2FBZ5_TRIV3|nr:regulation of choline O-acetyltransferase protein [Trichomonas vaginalis G3]EAX97594.1 GP63-like [Trichomonas vaginalis G3]KAI5516192.1 regulation of choline O-acetyltransferase protein [Trichomonas vaginalis G3]|eukprot:XP_001310524.1 GP63-like [Trichomonas vaginalis G3]
MFFLFVLANSHAFQCMHNENEYWLVPKIDLASIKHQKRKLTESSWRNIRIKIVTDFITWELDDEFKCKTVGQTISWERGTHLCTEDDFLNASRRANLLRTLDNVRIYIEKLLKVIPVTGSITMDSAGSYTFTYSPLKSYTGYDLILPVVLKNFGGDSPLAMAGPTGYERTYKRPISGIIYLNTKKIPDNTQSESTWQRWYFQVLIHEICHALGVTGSMFSWYHPYENSQPYNNPTCQLTIHKKSFTFLTTPYSHIFAKKRYGVETFSNGTHSCPSGIEIEDGGGEGTSGSHLEGRVFYSDLMTGTVMSDASGPFQRLTDAVMAILQDTGNYKCDWKYAQPLVWGNPESTIGGQPINDFATGVPSKVFPDHYMKKPTGDNLGGTGFDFKTWGSSSSVVKDSEISCPSNDIKYQQYCGPARYEFYNPSKADLPAKRYLYDYINVAYPQDSCPDGQAILPGATQFSNVFELCAPYKCNKYDSFTLNVTTLGKTTIIECNKSNVGAAFSYEVPSSFISYPRTAYCVHPEIFCRSVKLNEMNFVADPFDPNTVQLQDPYKTPSPTPNTPALSSQIEPTPDPNEPSESDDSKSDSGKKGLSTKMWIIIGASVGAVILIILIVTIIVCKVKGSKETSSDHDQDLFV